MQKPFKLSKYFLISFLSMLTLTTLVFASYSFYTYGKIKKDVTYASEEALKSFTSKVNSIFTNFDNTSIQIAMLPSVNELIYEIEATNLTDFINIRDNLELFSGSALYQSISLYFEASDRIYTTYGGLYPLSDFFDGSFVVKQLPTQVQPYLFYPPRTIARPFATPPTNRVISLARKIPLSGVPKGWVMINIDTDALAQAIISTLPSSPIDFGLIKDGKIFYATSPIFESWLKTNPGPSINQMVQIDHKNYSAYRSNLHAYGFQTVALLPQSLITHGFIKEMEMVLGIFILIVMGEFLLALFVTTLLSAPINLAIAQIQLKNPKQAPSKLWGIDGLNEALQNLFVHTDNISSKYEQNIPVLREGILLSILWDNNLSPLELDNLDLPQYGILLPHPYFYTFIAYTEEIDLVNTPTIKDQIRLYIKENVSTVFSEVGTIYSVFLGSNKLVFLLNTEIDPYTNIMEHQRFSNLFSDLHQLMLDELGIHVIFSFGTKEDAYTDLHRSYTAANNNLMFSSAFDDEFVVFYEEGSNSPVLNKIPLGHLIEDIMNKNHSGIQNYIDMISKQYFGKDFPFEKGKELLVFLVSSLYIGLWEKGIDVNPNDLTTSLSQIHSMTDFTHIQSYLGKTIQNLSCSLGFCQDTAENKNITVALDFIHQNYQRDISVLEIAESVGLNQVYLNRIFKLSTGKTLSEYLNVYRIEQSKLLLSNRDLSITEISAELGYNDVRSYIRFFKKFVGVTPGDYRGQ